MGLTRWQLLGCVAAFAGGAAITSAWRRPEVRIERVQERRQESQGAARAEAKQRATADIETRAQERGGSRTEERRPDGTVRVVTRWRERQAEAKERVVMKTEQVEVIRWKDRIEHREKLVESKVSPVQRSRFHLGAGPAWSRIGRPDGFAVTGGVRALGPLWLSGAFARAGGETTGALMLGVQW